MNNEHYDTMKSLVKLQIVTIFKSPVPYLLVFIVMPILFILSSSFLPAFLILPGMMVITILTMTFFVFGTALFQAKNSIIFKRLDVVGLTRAKFITGNAVLSIFISLCSIYILIELFAVVVGLVNIELGYDTSASLQQKGEIYSVNLLVPMRFNVFFVNDILLSLDDAIGLMLCELLDKAAKLEIIDPQQLANIFYSLADVIETGGPARGTAFAAIMNSVLDGLNPENAPHDIEKSPTIHWINQLADDILIGNGPIQKISDDMITSYVENGNHAPTHIFTDGLLFSPDEIVGDDGNKPVIGDSDNGNAIIRFKKTYSFHIDNGNGDGFPCCLLYSRVAPTISTLFSPHLNYDSLVHFDLRSQKSMMFVTGIQYFISLVIVSIIIYSMMLLFVSISNSFEQYSIFSGLTLILVFIFSGLVLPFSFILAFPSMFTFSSLIPTTPLVFELQYLGLHRFTTSMSAQPNANLGGTVAYPILISILLISISTRMLSTENGRLTKKFNHNQRSKNLSITNAAVNLLFVFATLFWYFSIVKYRIDNPDKQGSLEYPSNFRMFIPMFLMIIYTLLLFVNLVYLGGRSSTFYKYHKLIKLANAILLFPFGLMTLAFESSSKINTTFNS